MVAEGGGETVEPPSHFLTLLCSTSHNEGGMSLPCNIWLFYFDIFANESTSSS